MFRYELCNVGNIRKMKVIMPNIITTKIEQDLNRKSIESLQQADEDCDYVFTCDTVKPTEEKETLFGMYK